MFDRVFQVLVEFAGFFRFCVVLRDYERGVLLRFGKFRRVLEPGFHWLIPFHVDEAMSDMSVPTSTNLPVQTLTTADDVQVSLSAVVTWQVGDIRKFLLKSGNHSEIVMDSTLGIISRGVTSVRWADLQTEEFQDTLVSDIRKKARRWGMKVLDVQISDLAKTRTYRILSVPTVK